MIRIREGSVEIRIQSAPTGKYPAWRVPYTFAGVRKRKKFSDLEKAKEFARARAKDISEGRVELLSLSREDAAATNRALEALKPFGKTLDGAIAEYCEAQRTLSGASLSEAAHEYARRHSIKPMKVTDAVQRFLAAKTGLDSEYQRLMRLRLEKFSHSFACTLDAVTSDAVAEWLDARGGSLRTRNNYLNDVRTLVAHAKKHRWLLKDWDELERVELARAPAGKRSPFTPQELMKMLSFAQAHAARWLPYLAIRAFSGVRGEEVGRLRLHHFTPGYITADEDVTKTKIRRLIPILPSLARWLEKYPVTDSISPFPEKTIGARLVGFTRAAGVRNRHNGLRDSYISFRMAEPGATAGIVSQETGHSEATLRRSYREIRLPDGRVITPEVAAEWFAIGPKEGQKLSSPSKPQ